VPYLLPLTGLAQQLDETEKLLSQLGTVGAELDEGPNMRVSFKVDAPGYGLPTEAIFEFREWYQRTAQGWLRQRYAYEYRPGSGRKAHHMGHPGLRRAHQHCEPPGASTGTHYEDHERLLEPTAEELGALHARRRPIDCRELRPLRRKGDSARAASVNWKRQKRSAGL
jgi:hypothetical protein